MVIPTNALVICSIDFLVASNGDSFSSCIIRSTFSTTTIASSTNKPMASTKPNMVKVLIEKPNTDMMAKVPSNTTGTAIVGIKVARKFCKNSNMTKNTNTTASINVLTTSSMDIRIKALVSTAFAISKPAGNDSDSCANFLSTPACVSNEFAPEASVIAIPEVA